MIGLLGLLFTGVVVLVVITAVSAPIESLGWWAGWYGEKEAPPDAADDAAQHAALSAPAEHYLLYLSGIGAITDESIPPEEIKWLDALSRRIPGTLLVTDVFPYSVTNIGLTTQRTTARLWRRLEKRRLKNPMAAGALLINLRNVFQVTVSADQRYGPIFNLGVAKATVKALKQRGYVVGSGAPVTILGWSGGGQIALGSATFLKSMLKCPLRVISLGGVMANDPGINAIEHLYHLYGDKDPIQAAGGKLYPGRWKLFPQSDWNRALAEGKITFKLLGPLTHNGKGNYFDWETAGPDGSSCAEIALNGVTGALASAGLLAAPPPTIASNQAAAAEPAQKANNGRTLD